VSNRTHAVVRARNLGLLGWSDYSTERHLATTAHSHYLSRTMLSNSFVRLKSLDIEIAR